MSQMVLARGAGSIWVGEAKEGVPKGCYIELVLVCAWKLFFYGEAFPYEIVNTGILAPENYRRSLTLPGPVIIRAEEIFVISPRVADTMFSVPLISGEKGAASKGVDI